MRADRKPQPQASRTTRPRRRGRPKYYGIDQYMQVWLFVQEAMARTGLSANRVCLTHELQWIVAGRGGSDLGYGVRKATLRSLYQRAVRILKCEREEHYAFLLALRQAGASSPREAEPPPVETFWKGELQRRLALPC